MADLQKLITDFKELSLEDKKKKVKNIINEAELKKLDTVFITIEQDIDTNPAVDEAFLVDLYSRIMKYGDDLHTMSQEEKMKEFTAIHAGLQKMHEREAAEKAEENADDTLSAALDEM